jgi:hypothetical protein
MALFAMTVAAGCNIGGPGPRAGYLPTATFGVHFADPDNLGRHSYGFGPFEAGGIVYTCKAGHVDIDHVRGSADMTRHLIKQIRRTLSERKTGFSFHSTGELSSHRVEFTYPGNWSAVADKDKVINEVAFSTAPYLALTATTWHEILTWFGVHFAGFEPEFNSAFSWEDTYSNLVGTRLGVVAVQDNSRSFDDAMTIAIDAKLRKLGVQPKATAIYASDKVRGRWYSGNFVPDTKMRNFDIGLSGSITPTLVPGIAACDGQPLTLPAPTTKTLKRYGFSMYHEIKPNVFEQGRIFKAAQSKKIVPKKHYPIIMEYIKKQAKAMGYKYDG